MNFAWGENVNAPLVHTAGNAAGSSTSGVNSVDNGSTGEFFNSDGTTNWAGWAFAEFSLSDIPSGKTISSATLTYSIHMGENKSRTYNLNYLNAGVSLSSTNIDVNKYSVDKSIYDMLVYEQENLAATAHTACKYNGNRTSITVTDNALTQARKDFSQDVTSAVRAIYGAGQNYIIFQWTASLSYSYLHGKSDATYKPTLTITYTDETLYTASFTANSGAITPTVTIYSDAGRTSTVTNGTLLNGTTYYYRAVKHGYVNYEGSFTVNGADPSVSFTMTAAEKVTSLSVYAKISGANHLIKTIDLDDKYVGDQVSFTYPRFYKISTTLYIVSDDHYNAHGGYYKWNNYTLDGSSVVLDYNGGTIENVVYYSEGENIADMTADGNNNGDIRCSGGQGGRSSKELSLTSLGAGQYKLTSRVWGSTGVSYTYKAAGGEILVHALTGALDDKTVPFNVVSGTAAITVQGSGNANGKVLDYVYIQKTDDDETLIYNGDFENSTWDKGWNGTGTDKAKAFAKQTSSQSWGATGNFAEMWTNSSFSTEANLNQILVNVPAGSYTLSADILNNVSSSGGILYAKVGSASDVTTAAENASGANESVSFNVAATSNVVVGFKTTALNGKSGWIAVDNFELEQTAVSGTITPAGWSTFASSYPLDLSTLTAEGGATAYYASAASGSKVTLTSTTATVPTGEGIMIKGIAGETFTINVAESGTAIDGNLLKGQTTTGNVAASTAGTYHYVFGFNTADPSIYGFYNLASATSVPAGKAYLETTTELTAGARISIVFEDETTGISLTENSELRTENAVYDLQGRRVAQPQKGLYIVNGKKVIK